MWIPLAVRYLDALRALWLTATVSRSLGLPSRKRPKSCVDEVQRAAQVEVKGLTRPLLCAARASQSDRVGTDATRCDQCCGVGDGAVDHDLVFVRVGEYGTERRTLALESAAREPAAASGARIHPTGPKVSTIWVALRQVAATLPQSIEVTAAAQLALLIASPSSTAPLGRRRMTRTWSVLRRGLRARFEVVKSLSD